MGKKAKKGDQNSQRGNQECPRNAQSRRESLQKEEVPLQMERTGNRGSPAATSFKNKKCCELKAGGRFS